MHRLCAALMALLMCANVAVAGPEWVEDDQGDGDGGNNGADAQVTRGTGALTVITGRISGISDDGRGKGSNDFEDLYLIRVLNENAFSASLAEFFGGVADFDARLYLFDANEFGVLANDDTFFAGVTLGTGKGDDDDYDDDDDDKDPEPQPQMSSGPTIRNAATDGTNSQVEKGQLYYLGVTYAPNAPTGGSPELRGSGGGGEIFSFANPFEVSGPDGPGGSFPLGGWTQPPFTGSVYTTNNGPQITGEYIIALQGVGFAEPLSPPGVGGPADRGTATEKGTVLVYSKVDLRWDQAGNLIQDTFLTLSNDYPEDVRVQLYYVNGDPPLPASGNERAHPGWNWAGIEVWLTSDQPTYWSAATGLGGSGPHDPTFTPFTVLDDGLPPGRPATDGTDDRVLRGFIIAWPVNEVDHEIRWNHLAGEGTLVNYQRGSAWSYLTWAFHSVNDAVPHGAPTGTPGVLNFDGNEFSRPYGELLMNFQAINSTAYSGPSLVRAVDTDLTLHPLTADLRQETTGPVTTKADFATWNQNEVKLSAQHRCITCWDQQLLSQYDLPNHFFLSTLQTTHGKARIDGVASQNCDLDLFGVGGPGTPPDGVIDFFSQPAALLGVRATHLQFDTGPQFDLAGGNLFGLGVEEAIVRVDTVEIPPELWDDGILTPEEIRKWRQGRGRPGHQQRPDPPASGKDTDSSPAPDDDAESEQRRRLR